MYTYQLIIMYIYDTNECITRMDIAIVAWFSATGSITYLSPNCLKKSPYVYLLYIYIRIFIYVYMYIYMDVYIWMYIYGYIHIYVSTFRSIYAHDATTHTQSRGRGVGVRIITVT
jgi:hypothetical protein